MILADMRLASAAVVSVLMTITTIVAGSAAPRGEPVVLVRRSGYPPGVSCIEQRIIIVRVGRDHKLFINSEPIKPNELVRRLDEIFRTRVERVAYVLGAPDIPFGEVAGVIGAVREVVPNVGLLTPSTVPTMSEPLLQWPNGSYPVKTVWP